MLYTGLGREEVWSPFWKSWEVPRRKERNCCQSTGSAGQAKCGSREKQLCGEPLSSNALLHRSGKSLGVGGGPALRAFKAAQFGVLAQSMPVRLSVVYVGVWVSFEVVLFSGIKV